jgi:hypothetical protein
MPSPPRTRTGLAAVVLLGVTAVCTWCAARASTALPEKTPTPQALVVVISVDGLGWEQLDRYRPWYVGGLKKLLAEGRVEQNCRFQHFLTEDAPGHASLSTGALPRVHGIVADRWLERRPDGQLAWAGAGEQPWAPAPGAPPLYYREVKQGNDTFVFAIEFQFEEWQRTHRPPVSMVNMLAPGDPPSMIHLDSQDAVFLYALRHGKPTNSLPTAPMPGAVQLRVPTLGDELARQKPGSRVIVLGGTATGAVMLGGKARSHNVYWFDPGSGTFITSGAFELSAQGARPVREAIMEFNERQAGQALPVRLGAAWRKLPLSEQITRPDELPAPVRGIHDYQVPVLGLGFDHDLARHPGGVFAGFGASPLVDDLVSELALALASQPELGFGTRFEPDLLVLQFAAFDAVAHAYGAESEEALEVVRRLDRSLGTLLQALEEVVGKDNLIVTLGSNHGFAPIPEVQALRDKEFIGGRLPWGPRTRVDFVDRLNRVLTDALCLDPRSRPIIDAQGWGLHYSRKELSSHPPCTEGAKVGTVELDAAVEKGLQSLFAEEISVVLLKSRADRWPAHDSQVEFARNSLDPERAPDVFLVLKPGVIIARDPARGSSHGGIYDHDLHVPLLLWGAGITPGAQEEPSSPYDLAPTVAKLLGITMPQATGQDLLAPDTSR